MTRLRLDLGYDGTDFHGWAAQEGLRTVQGELEQWIQRVARLDHRPRLTCAGRTDAGVHARGQVAHLDLADTDEETAVTLERRLRRVLPPDLVVWRVRLAPVGFDARFSAIWRRYVYRLSDGLVDPLQRRQVVSSRRPLDHQAMAAAASGLVGLHDFAAFCRRREGATTIRTLQRLDVVRTGDMVELTVVADAFCHSMVRSLVGALLRVGHGERSAEWPAMLLARDERAGEITVMPPGGLVLEEVGYPPDDQLAARALEARATRTLEVDR